MFDEQHVARVCDTLIPVVVNKREWDYLSFVCYMSVALYQHIVYYLEAHLSWFSNDPVIDTRIPIYIHHCDEIHNWTCKRSKYYYDHIVEHVLVRPSSEQYWDIVSGQRITEHFLYKSYFCKVKQIKDKK